MSFGGGAREDDKGACLSAGGSRGQRMRVEISPMGDRRGQRETASSEVDAVSWVCRGGRAVSDVPPPPLNFSGPPVSSVVRCGGHHLLR